MFEVALAPMTLPTGIRQLFSISKAMTRNPATIVAIDMNTARLAIGLKFLNPKT